MCEVDLSKIASVLRPLSSDIIYGREKLCLSTHYLNKLNSTFEEDGFEAQDMTSSFHLVQTSSSKSNTVIRDIQFLSDLVQKTVALKIIPEQPSDDTAIDLGKFKNVRTLEIHKINIKNVLGIQKVRPQLQYLSCFQSLESLSDVLDKCGGDNSQRYIWSELKKGTFSYNDIKTFDDSFECTPWLHTLDLSHNQLKNISQISSLPNLKYLNLSYNKLEQVPKFLNQLCTRLQILILNNNFIEDISGITTVINLVQLDLSHNCLVDHNVLLNVSHLLSLQYLNLQGNPLYYHPQHRRQTCSRLHKNTSTLKFVLDNIPLNSDEKICTGCFHPMLPRVLMQSSSSEESVATVAQEKPRRVRNVTIEEDNLEEEKSLDLPSSLVCSQHLEIKKQVEYLRREYGDSWLYRDSGLVVQDVLGFQKTSLLSSTPAESDVDSLSVPQQLNVSNKTDEVEPFVTATSQSYFTAENTVVDPDKNEEISDVSDGEDICSGDEGIYLATNEKKDQVFVVLTDTHISERDVSNSKEMARWHVNTIVSCQKLEDRDNTIQLDFDTVRRDRKQRIYELDNAENFLSCIQEKIVSRPEEKKTTYQCMKCSEYFEKKDKELAEGTSLTCPKCQSNLVIESM